MKRAAATLSPAAKLLPCLDRVRSRGDSKWMARCPSHEDNGPSLSIEETADGTLLIHCFAGCSADEILGSVDLTLADLFPNPMDHKGTVPRWPAKDLLLVLSREFDIVLIAANDIAAGKPLTQDGLDRLAAAARRVQRVKEILRVA